MTVHFGSFQLLSVLDRQSFAGADPAARISHAKDPNSDDTASCIINPDGQVSLIFTNQDGSADYQVKFPTSMSARAAMRSYPVGEVLPEDWGFVLVATT